MQDRPTTMMILRALQEIVTELKAIREELRQMNQPAQPANPDRGRRG